jgi:hypothetical protein
MEMDEMDGRVGVPCERDYWIGHCEGFRVEGSAGRIGFVEEVRAGTGPGQTVLAVRAGMLGRRVLLISVDEVFSIVPRAQRLWLRNPVSLAGSEPFPVEQLEPVDEPRGSRRRRLGGLIAAHARVVGEN